MSSLASTLAPSVLHSSLVPSHLASALLATRGGGFELPSPVTAPSRRSYELWHDNMPEFVRFFTAGLVGNYAFYHITQVMTPRLTMFPPAHRPTLSFFFSYLLELPLQHFLNALICYKLSTICGQYPGQYLRTLGLTYATYINAIWITTLLKAQLARFVEEKWAFIGSVYGVGIVNMFVLGRLMKDKEGGKK